MSHSEMTVYTHGTRRWHLNGRLHRLDGPAIEYPDGERAWWVNDQLHRLDGPAVEYPDGKREWWVNGRELREPAAFERAVTAGDRLAVEAFAAVWDGSQGAAELMAAVRAA